MKVDEKERKHDVSGDELLQCSRSCIVCAKKGKILKLNILLCVYTENVQQVNLNNLNIGYKSEALFSLN